jgi:methylmalonyl-CoA mutase C-terminal domain/subunit
MPARILVAKPGLDGHDRGAKIVARTLRDAGFEVIFTGIRQKIDAIVATAIQEDVQVVGLSILSGAHLALTVKTIEGLRKAGAGDIAVIVGGTIPAADVDRLRQAGAAAVFPTGTPLESVVTEVRGLTAIPRGDDPPYPPMSERAGLIAKTAIVSGPPAPTESSEGDDPGMPDGMGTP